MTEGWTRGEAEPETFLVRVPFTNRRYRDWRAVVTVEWWHDKADELPPGVEGSEYLRDWFQVTTKTLVRGVAFERVAGDGPMPPSMFERFPVKWATSDAADVACEADWDAFADRPPLPSGKPVQHRDNDAWYRRYYRTVVAWQALGMTLVDVYREVGRRKGVAPTTAKDWWRKAQRVTESDRVAAPAAVGRCAKCGGPILPGAVAVKTHRDGQRDLFHPGGCADKTHRRMVVRPDGEVEEL